MSGRELTLDRRLDELFAVPPEEFVRARDWLVRALKESGDPEGAAHVRALRRPTVAAWAVNRLVRMRRAEVKELISVGEELRRAQRRALSGVGAGTLREVSDRRRQIESRLLAAAAEILEGRGGGSALEEIASTLSAAVLDEESAGLVARGRLERPLEAPSTFDLSGGLSVVESEDPEAERARRQIEELEATAHATRREAAEAEERARRAEEEADRLDQAALTARERADAARERAREARRSAEQEERSATEAEARLEAARGGDGPS